MKNRIVLILYNCAISPRNQVKLRENSGLKILINLVTNAKESYDVRDNAAWTLHMCARNPENKVKIRELDGLPALLDFLNSGKGQGGAASAFASLIVENPENELFFKGK